MKKVSGKLSLIAVFGIAGCILLSGCGTLIKQDTSEVQPLKGPPVREMVPLYGDVLLCLREQLKQQFDKDHRRYTIAVDTISDRTGKYSSYGEGKQVPQGAEDMMVSALAQTGAYTIVERNNKAIPVWEYNIKQHQALKHYQKEGKSHFIGSDYVVTGSISELNFNISSNAAEVNIAGFGGGFKKFWMDVGMDIRVVDTRTLQVVTSLPIRKQLWGYENKAGVTRFFGSTFVAADANTAAQEPVGLAVRAMIEYAAIEITEDLYKINDHICRYNAKLEQPNSPNDRVKEAGALATEPSKEVNEVQKQPIAISQVDTSNNTSNNQNQDGQGVANIDAIPIDE